MSNARNIADSDLTRLSVDGTTLVVDDTNNRVGIGTSSPSAVLDIEGTEATQLELKRSGTAGQIAAMIFKDGGDAQNRISSSSSNLIFGYGSSSTEAMRIDSSGNVGVGTSSPDIFSNGYERNVGIAGSGPTASLNIAGSSASRIQLGVGTSRYAVIYADASNFLQMGTTTSLPITFQTNSTERMRITSDGYLRMASGTGGIQFGGDTAAANALDDYEEGTWTPTITRTTTNPTLTYSNQTGHYTKIGRLVHVDCVLVISGVSAQGSGYVALSGLPFASGGSTYECVGLNGYNDIFADSGASVERSWSSGSAFRFIFPGETQGDYQGNLSTGYLTFSATYFV